jgi:glycosyltransferase involved in cell wall biosynthesis
MSHASRVPVSVIVLTLDEERTVEACLQSVAAWAGEIFVVDSGSHDRTVEISRRSTEQIVEHPFETYSDQRNWAQTALPLKHSWVLHLDADERVTPELADSIRQFFARGDHTRFHGAMFSRRTVFLGRWIRHGGHYPAYHARLFDIGHGRCEDRRYDQHFLVDPPIARLSGDLVDVVASDLDSFSIRHVRWAGAEAAELLRERGDCGAQVQARPTGNPIERRRWLRRSVYGSAPPFARAFAYFIYRYVLRLGFLDGYQGLIFHFLQGCWTRFLVDAKMWEARQTGLSSPAIPESMPRSRTASRGAND